MVTRHRALCFVLALVLASAARAAEDPQSPACALLTEDEAIVAVNGAPVVGDGGPEQKGYSDCAWSNTGGSAVMSVLFWSAAAFDGEATAEKRYERIVAALKRRHLPVDPVGDLGQQALMLDEGSPGLAAYTLIILHQGAVVQIADRGVTRSATLAVAKAIVGRMGGGEMDAGAATACALLTDSDLPGSGFAMRDHGATSDGESACTWQHERDNIDISVILRAHKPAPPGTTDFDFYTELPPADEGHDREPLPDVGEKAGIESEGEDPNATYTVTLMERGKVAILSTFRVTRDQTVKLASTLAGRM